MALAKRRLRSASLSSSLEDNGGLGFLTGRRGDESESDDGGFALLRGLEGTGDDDCGRGAGLSGSSFAGGEAADETARPLPFAAAGGASSSVSDSVAESAVTGIWGEGVLCFEDSVFEGAGGVTG